jgi:hypothetical protein
LSQTINANAIIASEINLALYHGVPYHTRAGG